MYIKTVREILETDVSIYAGEQKKTEKEILQHIRKHINSMRSEHYTEDPSIDYEDPLCRLGYLYKHAPANATLFEHVLTESYELSEKIRQADGSVLNVCAVGGGPGTELLGIAKYLVRHPDLTPRKIAFTVLDNVSHWAETWEHLVDVIEASPHPSHASNGLQSPVFAPSFIQLDVLKPESYQKYMYKFRKADIVVCNYLFSENKTRLDDARLAIASLAELTPPGCTFVVIDRLEGKPQFQNAVVDLFESVFGDEITMSTYGGTLDQDEQVKDMGQELRGTLGSPRVKFFQGLFKRVPTVFWFVVNRG